MKTIARLFALIALTGLFVTCKVQHPSPKLGPIRFTVLQVNDVYEIAPVEKGTRGGMARLMTVKQQLLEEDPDLITVLSGDFLSPSLLGSLKMNGERIAGAQMVDLMNAVGFDYVTFGNHEFDLNYSDLQKRIDESEFTWISTNTFQADGTPFMQRGKPMPETVLHSVVEKGYTLKVGFIGLCLDFNEKDYVTYEDFYETTRTALEDMEEAEVTFAITHQLHHDDSLYALQFPGFARILGGHDHENMYIPVGPTAITKADLNARTAYVHRVTYNPGTGTARVDSELVNLDTSIALDPEISARVQKWEDLEDSLMRAEGYEPDEVLTVLPDTLEGREAIIRSQPTNYGTQTAEAMLALNPEADLVIVNSGSFRADAIYYDTLYMVDILSTFTFGGAVGTMAMKGSDLQAVLAQGLTNKGSGGYLQTLNVTEKEGAYYIKNEPLHTDSTYAVVMPEFIAKGGEISLPIPADAPFTYPDILPAGIDQNDIRDIVAHYYRNK
ncbi:bifunctional UDP-sugar hydrolase/5'-nucleotidase [Roseivirga sp. BDSF3-8]|uniref:bifunctional metallophosphatase/5'-nucleotidase n=1 Tax=Roseivirga sp. BDSF3-8 TaxID=3241598 RepID=UPI0035318B62